MSIRKITLVIIVVVLTACNSKNDDPAFLSAVSGRYLYNADEELRVYIENDKLYLNWRGAAKITPLKVSNDIYYIKEMNEKIQFRKNPIDTKYYISIVPKESTAKIGFDFVKLNDNEHIPSYYLENNQFEKALEVYKGIQEKDSLSALINEAHLNRTGYNLLGDKKFEHAIEIFKLNVELHPESANVYDSLGDALIRNGDTLEAVSNYRKSLEFDSGNRRAKRIIEKYGN